MLAALAAIAAQDPAMMTIAGRIVSATTGKPVPGAAATATCDDCDTFIDGKADADGRFQITLPTPSRYRVFASAPGWVTQTYGDQPELGGTPIAVQKGAHRGDVDFRLHRGSTIAGVVTDEFKEPVIGAAVSALARRSVDGERPFLPLVTTRTNDRGAYRLIGLESGEYLIRVSEGLAAAFAPSANTSAAARRVTIGTDTEQDGINIQTKPTPRGGIEGIVAGPGAGSPALAIQLLPEPNPADLQALTVRAQPGGRFTIADVPAGRYALFERPTLTASASANTMRAWARQPVVVVAGTTTHVALTLREGARISGRVVSTDPVRGKRILITPIESDHPEAAPAVAVIDADGSFTVANVPPGRYRLGQDHMLTGAGRWILSVFMKDVDVSDAPLEITADAVAIDNVRMTLTPPARVAGTVLDANGRPTTAGAVVIAADESRYWTPVSRRIRVVRPDTEGTFEFRLPAGRYHVIPVSALAPGQLWDQAFLKTVAGGRAVIATEGQVATVQLRLK